MQKEKPKNQVEKELLIHEYLSSSGKEKMAWCKEKGIPYNTFYKWLRDYESKDINEPKFIDLSSMIIRQDARSSSKSKIYDQTWKKWLSRKSLLKRLAWNVLTLRWL